MHHEVHGKFVYERDFCGGHDQLVWIVFHSSMMTFLDDANSKSFKQRSVHVRKSGRYEPGCKENDIVFRLKKHGIINRMGSKETRGRSGC